MAAKKPQEPEINPSGQNISDTPGTEPVSAPVTVTPVAPLVETPPVAPVVVAPTPQKVEAPAPAYVPPVVQMAPAAAQPRQMRVERQGARSEPYTRRFPQVRGGICEFCGVLDRETPSQYQYKLCPHYRGMQLQCSYCPSTKDPDDVIYHTNLNVAESPSNPNELIVWCDAYECSKAHNERFQKNRS